MTTEPQNPDTTGNILIERMKEIASEFDLQFNIWRPEGNTLGRLYLNRTDRTAVCWIEENCSKNWIDTNIGEILHKEIKETFDVFIRDYNAWYKWFEEQED